MNRESRETLNRVSGILEGLSVSENITEAETNLIVAASEMIDAVLNKEDTE
jgi:hypothetical protein